MASTGFNTSNNYQQADYGNVTIDKIQAEFNISDFPSSDNIQNYNNTVIAEEFDVFENTDPETISDISNEQTETQNPSTDLSPEVNPTSGQTDYSGAAGDNSGTSPQIDQSAGTISTNPSGTSGTNPTETTDVSTPSTELTGNGSAQPSTSSGGTSNSYTGAGSSNPSNGAAANGETPGTDMTAGGTMMAGGMVSGGMGNRSMGGNGMQDNGKMGSTGVSTLGKGQKEDEKDKDKKPKVDPLTGEMIGDDQEESLEGEETIEGTEITETGTTYTQENEEAETLYDMEGEEK